MHRSDAVVDQSAPTVEPVPSTVPAPVSDADRTTRERVLTSILSHGPSTAADLSERLSLTPAAIRRHLTVLVDSGMVTSREQRVYGHRGRGRPAKVFLLTDAGRASFPQAYDELASEAIQILLQAAGPQALTALAEQRVADIELAYQRLRAENPDADPVEHLAAALNEGGYVTSIEPVASGEQLCQHHCPVAGVASQFPELCVVETRLFSRLLDSHVQRLATIAHGENVCTTHVPNLAQVQRAESVVPPAARHHPPTGVASATDAARAVPANQWAEADRRPPG